MKDKPVVKTDGDLNFTGGDLPIVGGTASDAAHGLTGSQSQDLLLKSNSQKTLTKSIDKKSGSFTQAKVSVDNLNRKSIDNDFSDGGEPDEKRNLPGAFGSHGQANLLDINRLSKDQSIAKLTNSTIKSESKKSRGFGDNYSDEIVVG